MRLEIAHPIPRPIFILVNHVAGNSIADLERGDTEVLGEIIDPIQPAGPLANFGIEIQTPKR